MINLNRVLPTVLTALVLLLSFGCAPAPKAIDELEFPELDFSLPTADSLVLDNGIRLYLMEDRELPLIQMTAMVGAGAITTPKEKTGFESLFGTTWRTGGAGERSPQELEDFLDLLAADLNASMGPYTSQVDLSLRSKDLDEGIEILSDMLRRPQFAADRLELARLQAQESVRRQNDNPGSISQRLLMASLYPDNYLGFSATHETLAAIAREDLVDFHKTFFAPNDLWIAISGDFDRDALLQLLQAHLGDWQPREVPAQPMPQIEQSDAGPVQVVEKDIPQTTILIGDLSLTKDNPDQYALKVMNYILGGGGFNSRLMREIRSNRGLAYSVYSYFQVGRKLPGPFVAGTETKSESVVPALNLMREIMTDLSESQVSLTELNLAKESLINSYVFGFENSHSVVSRQMSQDFYDYPEDYISQYQKRIAAVTIDDVRRVAREYIDVDRQQVILVGDFDAFRGELQQAGLNYIQVELETLP